MNLAKNLEMSAFYFTERPAISEDHKETSYALLNERANQVATALLKIGIAAGDHVALCAPNSGDWLAFYFGVIKIWAVAVTLSSQLKADELTLLINHSRPKAIFTHDEKLGDLEKMRDEDCLKKIICPEGDLGFEKLLTFGQNVFKAVDAERTDTAAILYTGGTTGIPKGVTLSHENINAAIHTVVHQERSTEYDKALCFLPFNHVFGQMHIMNATVLSGGCLELMPGFDLERVLALMKAGRITKFFSVPTIYVRLLTLDRLKETMGDVRYCFSAAASMAAETVHQWKERTGLSIYEGYGMTEAAPTVAYNHQYRHVIGSVGTAVPGVEIQIRDENGNVLEPNSAGEVCVRGPNIMKGYYNNTEGTREAFWPGGWFRSGDVGVLNENGYLSIVDRLKDMIISGGENVYSTEVEEVLYIHPDVQECAVIGTPDKEWGEIVTAFILPKPGRTIDEMELKDFLKARLSAYKVPKQFSMVGDFPRSPAGKLLKRKLRQSFLKGDDST
ncbi:MAG: AMP-binding protein [Desulfobacteraceae bacterium]|jgi:long-chain acyl-CoA synthetase|nr:AMP-binding protein [Desulfobacteraceae bacterium]